MDVQCKQHIINLFNAGVLSLESARWYMSKGYSIICEGGKVVDMVRE